MATLAQLVGDPDLAEGRLLQRERNDSASISGGVRFFSSGLRRVSSCKRQLAAGVVELLEAVEAVARVAHHLAGLADVAELLGKLQQPNFGADDLLFLGHGRCPPNAEAGRFAPRPLRAPPRLSPQPNDTVCQIKS